MTAEMSEESTLFQTGAAFDRDVFRSMLLEYRAWLRDDPRLMTDLGLRLDAANIVDFGPVALSRVSAAHQRESSERRRLEAIARANFAAQTQTHAAVIDVMDATSLPDLAKRVDDLARSRFGLAVGALALEGGATPNYWITLAEGQRDLIMGATPSPRLGFAPTSIGLFGAFAWQIKSVALAEISIWDPARKAVLALGSTEPDTFTSDMGGELVTFLASVIERTAARWPRP